MSDRPDPAGPEPSMASADDSSPIELLIVGRPATVGLRLTDGRVHVVGRGAEVALSITDSALATRHFSAQRVAGGVRVEALDGAITYGAAQIEAAVLPVGARLEAGGMTFAVHREAPAASVARFGEVIAFGPAMRSIFDYLRRVAASDLTVLIEGETGTGKELAARAIHQHSPRASRPFVVVDCSAIPRELIESTLFGHEKGAFTGAINQRRGLFERADGGTVFLDEIGELDLTLQPKLLRVLESRELTRVGGNRTIHVDVRVIAATNRALAEMVDSATFREDLYFRLGVVQVQLPPLRERRDDVPRLVEHFLAEHLESERASGADRRAPSLTISPDALTALADRPWPGNVRELRNVVVRAASLADGPVLTREDFRSGPITPLNRADDDDATLRFRVDPALPFKDAKQRIVQRFEADYLDRLLAAHAGNISRSAQAAGLTRYHLRALLKKHGRHGPR